MRIGITSAALVAVAVGIAGCGSSSSSSTAIGSGSASSGSGSAVSNPASPASATKAPSFASAGNCQQLAGLGAKFAQAMSAATSNGKVDLSAEAAAYQSLANAAPSAIRLNLQVIAGALTTFASDLQKIGYKPGAVPSATQLASLQSAVKALEQPSLPAAENGIASWARQNCGVSGSGSSGTSGTSTSGY